MVLRDVAMRRLFQQLLAGSNLNHSAQPAARPVPWSDQKAAACPRLRGIAGAVLFLETLSFSPRLSQVTHALSSSHFSEQRFSNFSPKHPSSRGDTAAEAGGG